MSLSQALTTLQIEASCSVCLEYLRDPVIIECGHNFCRACITRWWAELRRDFPCPVCRKTSRRRSLRPNRQLANMVEAARHLRAAKRKRHDAADYANADYANSAADYAAADYANANADYADADSAGGRRCGQHGRALARFCRQDQAALCLLCEISHAHRAHATVPIAEAEREYKEKLQQQLELLEQKLAAVSERRAREERKPAELKRTVWRRRERIAREFQELHVLLEEEERRLLRRLRDEERQLMERLRDNLERLGERRSLLGALAAELEEKSLQPGPEMLQDIKDTLARCQAALEPAEEPEPVAAELERTFSCFPWQYFTLRSLTRRLLDELTLDPDTAHPNLLLSADLKSVRFVDSLPPRNLPDTPRRFTVYPCVLAAQGFTSGRHYWEVEVGDKTHWALGVCRDTVTRKGEVTPLPEAGYWRLRLWNGDKYAATTRPFTPLALRVKPRRVGVYLDYEAGRLAFYNVTDRSHIFTFSDSFSGILWPLFYPGICAGRRNAAPLVIRAPTDWE